MKSVYQFKKQKHYQARKQFQKIAENFIELSLLLFTVILFMYATCNKLVYYRPPRMRGTGRGAVPHTRPQVPGPHLRLHNGLVPALAERGADRRGRPLPVQVPDRVLGGSEAAGHTEHGHLPRRRVRVMPRVLPEVSQ